MKYQYQTNFSGALTHNLNRVHTLSLTLTKRSIYLKFNQPQQQEVRKHCFETTDFVTCYDRVSSVSSHPLHVLHLHFDTF